jgi:ABC-type nitrate/sulfonate/bicarbonate transport system substrate-binding protein
MAGAAIVAPRRLGAGWRYHRAAGRASGADSALRAGNTDGMAVDLVGGTVLQNQKIGRIMLHFGTIVPDFITHTTFARDSLIKDHPDELRGFLAGWFESVDFMLKHKAETVQIATKVTDMATLYTERFLPHPHRLS